MELRISVVIPTYNRKILVLEAISSVLQQEPKNYEVIVVDDGSTDGTIGHLKILNLPIKVIRKEKGGTSSARNEGIKNSKGEFIAFLDSDDIWLPGILEAQLQYLEVHPSIPLVYTDQYIESFGKKLDITRFTAGNVTYEQKSKFDLPGFMKSPPIHISSVMVRKSIFDEMGLFNENLKIHEDTEMWNRISEKYELGYIDKPLAIFRWEKDSQHVLKPEGRGLFISEGRKYMKIYEDRRKHRELLPNEKSAIKESYRRIDQLEEIVRLQENGKITEAEFNKRKDKIFQ